MKADKNNKNPMKMTKKLPNSIKTDRFYKKKSTNTTKLPNKHHETLSANWKKTWQGTQTYKQTSRKSEQKTKIHRKKKRKSYEILSKWQASDCNIENFDQNITKITRNTNS